MNQLHSQRPPTPPRVVLVDHDDSYTWNLAHLVAIVTGRFPEVVHHRTGKVDHVLAFDHIVLSAGPGHPEAPEDFGIGRDILRAARVPVLGICLGMQGLATVWGGRVERNRPAHGRVSTITHHDATGLFAGMPSSFSAVRYHSLAVTTLGPDLRTTATCVDPDGTVVTMGISHRDRELHGVQFHPESILSSWGEQLMRNFLSMRATGAR